MQFRLDELGVALEIISEKRRASRKWTNNEIELLRKEHRQQTREQLSAWLGRSIDAINAKLCGLGLLKNKKWTKEEIQQLIDGIGKPISEQVKAMNRTYEAINCKRVWMRKKGYIPKSTLAVETQRSLF